MPDIPSNPELNQAADPALLVPSSNFAEFTAAIESAQQNARDRTILMKDIGEMALDFSQAMVLAGMPVDHAIDETETPKYLREKGEPKTVVRTRHPLWIVVQGTDLSGGSLVQGMAIRDFGNKFEQVKPENFSSLKLNYGDEFRYDEWAVAVSCLGELMLVYRFYQDSMVVSYERGRGYQLINNQNILQILFNHDDTQAPAVISAEMKKRLTAAASQYSQLKIKMDDQELDSLGQTEYYFPELLSVELPDLPKSKKKRGFWHKS